jgi:hypothetical protein
VKKGKSKPGFKPRGDKYPERKMTKKHGGKGNI